MRRAEIEYEIGVPSTRVTRYDRVIDMGYGIDMLAADPSGGVQAKIMLLNGVIVGRR